MVKTMTLDEAVEKNERAPHPDRSDRRREIRESNSADYVAGDCAQRACAAGKGERYKMLTMILAVLTAALLAAVLYLLLERGRLCRVIAERRRDIRMLRKLVRECEGK